VPTVSIKEFLAQYAEGFLVVDARSEKEFEIGKRNLFNFLFKLKVFFFLKLDKMPKF